MKKTASVILSALILAGWCPAGVFAAQGDIYIGVEGQSGKTDKIPLAMPEFLAERASSPADMETARRLKEVVRADLLFSRYFDVDESAGPRVEWDDNRSGLEAWKKTGARYLVLAKCGDLEGKQWTMSVNLYDLQSGLAILSKYYRGSAAGLRRGGHLFSDQVVRQITGRTGIAHTRVAFANDSTGHKEIYLVDYDGKNLTQLTRDRSIALLPRWAPDGERLFYTTYRYRNPDTFEINLAERKIKPLSLYQGINLPGGVSPDGKELVLTLSRGRTPNIYIMNLETKQLRQLTKGYSVDSSATFSPDGNYVAFVSDRSGNPQIYVLEQATGELKRLTRLNWCDSPEWSPAGDWIVFSGREKPGDRMDIYLIDPTGSQLRRVTRDAGSNEDPSWSPDGRFIVFTSTRNNARQIYVMDADGSAPHLVERLPGKSYTPHWSP
ncbi:MAG: DPP IV N-terminal domain-containing protein [Elusimicrobiaceae bacterium]|nr:DPP IV N-terminal domain-containing protein [Elusimicrobiaceae bacterium]